MLRVGSVPYVVGRPLDLGLGEEPGIRVEHAVPADLVARLREGTLDVALVSSIELFRGEGYGYVDGLAVAGEREVSSVQVFLRVPRERVRRVALDPASRAAAALTRLVWPVPAPAFVEVAAGADPRAACADGWLRIGDEALREAAAGAAPWRFHPSAAWRERTGLPFVFAAWIVRPGVELGGRVEAFHRARRRGRRALGDLVREGARGLGLDPAFVADYLGRECLYEPGERMAASLAAFGREAALAGLCPAGRKPFPIGRFEPSLPIARSPEKP